MVFVFALWILSVFVEVRWLSEKRETFVAVRQGNMVFCVYSPENMPTDERKSHDNTRSGWVVEENRPLIILRDWLPGVVRAKWWRLVVVPLWIPAVGFLAILGGTYWRCRYFQVGCCQYCGYDLRGTVSKKC